ncbi:hypothetical protein D3C75_1034010 [compost metagenome]
MHCAGFVAQRHIQRFASQRPDFAGVLVDHFPHAHAQAVGFNAFADQVRVIVWGWLCCAPKGLGALSCISMALGSCGGLFSLAARPVFALRLQVGGRHRFRVALGPPGEFVIAPAFHATEVAGWFGVQMDLGPSVS